MTARWTFSSLARSSLPRCATALAAFVTAVAVPAARAGAQLAYDRSTFLHGIGSSPRVWGQPYPDLGALTPPQYLSRRVDLKAVGTLNLNAGAPDTVAGLRYADQRDNLVRFLAGASGRDVLFAHSLGSLVSRGAFAVVGGARVAGIVTVAAPHQGAPIADSAGAALRYAQDMLSSVDAAKANVKWYLAATFILGGVGTFLHELFSALDAQRSGGLPSAGGVTDLPRLAALKDLGPNDSAVVALNAYRGDGVVPRVNIRGSIPYAHALLRLAAATPGSESFEDMKQAKDKGLSLFRKCKNMGNWTFNASDPGNKCQRAANMLGALDGVWAAYTNGTTCNGALPGGGCWRYEPRKVPSDGVVPNERSNYPTSNGVTYDRPVDMATHLDIYRRRDALNAAADGMLLMGMREANTAPAAWQQVGGRFQHVSVGADGTVWSVNSAGQVYRLSGGSWEQMPGSLKQVAVGRASHVWGVNAWDEIYRWNGWGWDRIGGSLKQIAVASDGTVWGVNLADQIYRLNGGGWERVPGYLKQVSVGSASQVWGTNSADEIWSRTGGG